MPFSFSKGVAEDVRAAMTHGAPEAAAAAGPSAHVFDGGGELDLATARRKLESGETVAVINAHAGQLDGLDPDNGIKVPHRLSLYAVKRVPLQGHPGRHQTVVTMLPHADASSKARAGAPAAHERIAARAGAPAAHERIAARLRSHMAMVSGPTDFAPPQGTKWGLGTYSTTWEAVVTAPWGLKEGSVDLKGKTQTARIDMTQTWFAILADGDKANPYYVVCAVCDGTVTPSVSGGLIGYDGWYKGAVRNRYWVYVTPYSGLAPAKSAPGPTQQSPVDVEASYPMQVIADLQGGGRGMVPYTASFSAAAVPNPDWAISRPELNGWMYYNLTPWDASQQNMSNFGVWWEKVANGAGSGYIKELNPSCQAGGSFKTVVFWKFPGAEGSVTKAAFYTQAWMELVCFENRKDDEHSGLDQHINMGAWVPKFGLNWTGPDFIFDVDLDTFTRRNQ